MPKPMSVISLTLYDPETDEVKATYTRSIVPWGLLKQAVRLMKRVDLDKLDELDESTVDELAGLVIAVFGDKFSIQDLDQGADIEAMVAVLMAIMAKARGLMPNPTPPGKAS